MPDEYHGYFCHLLQRVRLSRGLSQYWFADFLGIPYSTYKLWEQGRFLPSYKNLIAILDKFSPAEKKAALSSFSVERADKLDALYHANE